MTEKERSWIKLIFLWLSTQIIWTLSNGGYLITEYLLSGSINTITWAVFFINEFGCLSICWTLILKEKVGQLNLKSDSAATEVKEFYRQVVELMKKNQQQPTLNINQPTASTSPSQPTTKIETISYPQDSLISPI